MVAVVVVMPGVRLCVLISPWHLIIAAAVVFFWRSLGGCSVFTDCHGASEMQSADYLSLTFAGYFFISFFSFAF